MEPYACIAAMYSAWSSYGTDCMQCLMVLCAHDVSFVPCPYDMLGGPDVSGVHLPCLSVMWVSQLPVIFHCVPLCLMMSSSLRGERSFCMGLG